MFIRKLTGLMSLGLAMFICTIFLMGGGVSRSTDGHIRSTVFLASFATCATCLGPYLYRSTQASERKHASEGSPARPRELMQALFLAGIVAALMIVFWQTFFRSEFFATRSGQIMFSIVIGVMNSVFVPVGLALIRLPALESRTDHHQS